MPTINIKGQEFEYRADDVIGFAEGLVGLPDLRRAVVVPLPGCEPFAWLASTEDEKTRFVVVDPQLIFADYRPRDFAAGTDADAATLVIVKVSSDWRQTTVNLRAPIFIDRRARTGVQKILTDSPYRLSEALPPT